MHLNKAAVTPSAKKLNDMAPDSLVSFLDTSALVCADSAVVYLVHVIMPLTC